ncbi:MAG: sensor histidine kinase, partial [Thermoanaerobaculia bacterium]
MSRRRLSIRWWLSALVAGAALPLLLLLIWIYEVQVRHEEAEARQTALRTAGVTAARMRSLHLDSTRLLERIAAGPAVRYLEHAPCDALFPIVDASPQYADLLLFDGDGNLVCSAEPVAEDGPVSTLARQWIAARLRERTLRPKVPVMRLWANRWVSLLSMPISGTDGALRGTLVLVQLPEALAEPLPPDAVMTILDRDGTIVARSNDPHRWTGRSARGVSIAELTLQRGVGMAEAIGLDGVSREYGFSSVPELGWRIYVGIPTASAREEVQEMFVHGVAGGTTIIVLVVITALMLAHAVERPVAALSGAAESASRGQFERVTAAGPREIAQLAETFNAM